MLEIGTSLREARSRRGLELADVEAATRIRARYLESLESEQFERLPAGPYARSFLREYADFLGLDGAVYAREYDLRFAPSEPEPPLAPRRVGAIVTPPLGERSLTWTAAVVVALALVAIGAWRLAAGDGGRKARPQATPVTRTRPRPPTHVRPLGPPRSRKLPSPLALTAARGSCWLSVRIGSAAGRTLYQATLQQGRTVRFGLRRPLWIRVGAPWNLDATIGHRSLTGALPSHVGDVLATSAGLRPAT